MGKPLLLLRLEGPLQSWGARSRWDVRDTQPEPTKSGVVGLLGCALGCERGDSRLLALDAGLRFGVRTEAPGRVLEDYQTVTDFLPTAAGDFKVLGGTKSAAALRSDPDARPATIISPRFYLEDAAFLVALEATGHAPLGLLADCARALQAPRWTLFLGRKACVPTRPIFEALTEQYEDLEDALRHHPWSYLDAQHRLRPAPKSTLTATAEPPAHASPQHSDTTRQDALRLNAARVYDFRPARRLPPITPTLPPGGTP